MIKFTKMAEKFAILYVDEEEENFAQFQSDFGSDYSIRICRSGMDALRILEKEGDRYALLMVSSKLSDLDSFELCQKATVIRPQLIRIILTSFEKSTPFLLESINRGHVDDYITTPWNKEQLKPILDKALKAFEEKTVKVHDLKIQAAKIKTLESEIRERYDSSTMIGENSGLRSVMEVIKKVAATDSTVLILGETGTGKELLARIIHDRSRRQKGPFVPVHCASLASTLMESELFGHEKGSFTGADQQHLGRFEVAEKGTIFLDEMGELNEEIQVKLLRVLQEKEIFRVGGNRPIPVDVRLLAATHRNLEEMVRRGKFREDLYYRLNVISLEVPSLRQRKEDIPALANYFLKKYCQESFKNLTLTTDTIGYLARYDWPGNIRELQNIIERAVILCEGPTIKPEDLNLKINQTLHVEQVNDSAAHPMMNLPVKSQIEAEEIQNLSEILKKTKGNISEAARLMKVPRSTLFHRLRRHQLV
jgi:DNA-binding NtrC family response regulator